MPTDALEVDGLAAARQHDPVIHGEVVDTDDAEIIGRRANPAVSPPAAARARHSAPLHAQIDEYLRFCRPIVVDLGEAVIVRTERVTSNALAELGDRTTEPQWEVLAGVARTSDVPRKAKGVGGHIPALVQHDTPATASPRAGASTL